MDLESSEGHKACLCAQEGKGGRSRTVVLAARTGDMRCLRGKDDYFDI